MVRPGLMCYGYFPNGQADPQGEIKPCLSLKARVSYFKVVREGEGISYNHVYRTKQQTRVVTVPVGYGDGYRRVLTNRAPVLIRGQKFHVSGTICMDQFMVDVGNAEVFVGDEVVLIGKQGEQEITLGEIAQLSGSIFNEVLCGFSDRLPRIYTECVS
jgi:alanine racemase